ncbi:MAG TPA: hypothetical protein VGW10_12235, partial [Solirubrobacteraceae bacterium]|nr:hypothetical protein [Solirubrobacteraceae bacterium]
MPFPTPPAGRPLRLAFVGQRTFFEVCALGDERPDVATRFLEFRRHGDATALRADLDAFGPDVVVVFRPEIVPAGTFAGLRATTLGFLTEPIPRDAGGGHHDLDRRRWELEQVDASSFDRVVSFDPLIASTAESILPVWRSVPLPVSDRLYRDVRPVTGKPRVLFVGRSTPHREQMLAAAKAEHPDLLHEAFGVGASDLESLLGSHDVGINLHNDTYWSFENRVCLHLAAGHLVLSEPLSPQHGLERGIDYLEVSHGGGLAFLLTQLEKFPRTWHRVRVRGRIKAEQFRASRVWPRLVSDLHADLAAFGTHRVVG